MDVAIGKFESFTYNLFQYVSSLTAHRQGGSHVRNDRTMVAELHTLQPDEERSPTAAGGHLPSVRRLIA